MTQRMERFSQEARRVLNASEREATDMDHPAIMPLHLLLGMLEVTNCKAYRILRELSLEHRDVLPLVQELSPTMVHAIGAAPRRVIELSSETRRVLEYGVDEARKAGADYIGSEHLLLGLMRKPDYAIIHVLQRASLDPDTVRRTARRMMIDADEAPESAERATNGAAPAGHIAPDPRMKIIELVEAGKLTAAEAGDLLRALQSTALPAAAFTNRVSGDIEQVRARKVRMVISDKATQKPKADLLVPVERLQAEVFALIQLLYSGYTGKVGDFATSADQITISIE